MRRQVLFVTSVLLFSSSLSSCITPALWKNRHHAEPDSYVGAVGSSEVESDHFSNSLWFKIPVTPVAVALDLCGLGVIGFLYLYLEGDDEE